MTRGPVRYVVLGVALAAMLAGCKVNARVEIAMRNDGTGVVRTTIGVDADAVQQLGGATAFAQSLPLADLRAAGWAVSPWKRATNGSRTVQLSHPFVDQADLRRRLADLAGANGILKKATLSHDRGWFSSHDSLSVVVDVRSPSVDVVHDAALARGLRAAGADPAQLQAQLTKQLKTALHVTVVVKLPDGKSRTYEARPGAVTTVHVESGGTDWDHVVRFGIGLALALLAALFFLAAGMGARRNRRRVVQRARREPESERAPLM